MQNFNANANLRTDGQTDERTSDERYIPLGIHAGGIAIRQYHWTMNKGQGHGWLHECIAAAALKGICYLTKYELSGLKGIHQN